MSRIQGIYVALFGRPADPEGLAYFNAQTKNGADLSAIGDLAGQPEYLERFQSVTTREIVNSIYKALFNRDADAGGLKFFSDALAAGQLSIKNIAIAIAESARSNDKAIIDNKIAAAELFTKSLDTPEKVKAYSGTKAADIGRALLSEVTVSSASVPDATEVATYIKAIETGTFLQPFGGGTSSVATITGGTSVNANAPDFAKLKSNLDFARVKAAETEAKLNEVQRLTDFVSTSMKPVFAKETVLDTKLASLIELSALASKSDIEYYAEYARNLSKIANEVSLAKEKWMAARTNDYTASNDLIVARVAYEDTAKKMTNSIIDISSRARIDRQSFRTELGESEFSKFQSAINAFQRAASSESSLDRSIAALDDTQFPILAKNPKIENSFTKWDRNSKLAQSALRDATNKDTAADSSVAETKALLRSALDELKINGGDNKLITEMEKAFLPVIALSSNTFREQAVAGEVVSDFKLPTEIFQNLQIELVGNDTGRFELVQKGQTYQVVLKVPVDSKVNDKPSIAIKVSNGVVETTYDETFVLNKAPVLTLSPDKTVFENVRAGTVVGNFSAVDPEGDKVSLEITGDYFFKNDTDPAGIARTTSLIDYNGTGSTKEGDVPLHVKATDAAGNVSLGTINVKSLDVPFVLNSAPTGKNYISAIESLAKGTKIDTFKAWDENDFNPISYELVANSGSKFAIQNEQGTPTLVLLDQLDFETSKNHVINVKGTDANGKTREASFTIYVVDAAETGAIGAGAISIDASNVISGFDWNTYLYDIKGTDTMRQGTGVTGVTPTQGDVEPTYTNKITSDLNGTLVDLIGKNIAYRWDDFGSQEKTGEDVHIVTGTVNEIVVRKADALTPELKITGLNLYNDSSLLNRILGETNVIADGLGKTNEKTIAHIKGILAQYSQTFTGSMGDDQFSGTVFDDTFKGSGGNDIFDGGAGKDIAIFGGAKGDYTVKFADGKTTVQDNRSAGTGDGLDTLTNIEVLQFSDGSMTSSVDASNVVVWA